MFTRAIVLGSLAIYCAHPARAQEAHVKRLTAAEAVLKDIMEIADRAIPQQLLDRSRCVAVVPGMKKGAFIFGGKYGRGYLSCRRQDGSGWSAPAALRLEGGSFGFQVGAKEADVVMLVMNERGVERLLTSKFTLGGEASVAAGPVGRTASAQTDALLTAEILSWSRSRGLFAGISLQGATLRQDLGTNRELYGATLETREIVLQDRAVPQAATALIGLLNQLSKRD